MHSRTHGMREHPLRPWRVTFPVATGGFLSSLRDYRRKITKKKNKSRQVNAICLVLRVALAARHSATQSVVQILTKAAKTREKCQESAGLEECVSSTENNREVERKK